MYIFKAFTSLAVQGVDGRLVYTNLYVWRAIVAFAACITFFSQLPSERLYNGANKKPRQVGLFEVEQDWMKSSAVQPRIDSRDAVLRLPGFKTAVVAALGLDQFTCVRVLVNLHNAGAAPFRARRGSYGR